MKYSISLFLCLFLCGISTGTFAQKDSADFVHYDVIYLKNGEIIKGDLLSFDEASGGIVFQDIQGRKYSFGRDDYDYFLENKAFPLKKGKIIKDRKENEFEVHLGLSAAFININNNLSNDDEFSDASGGSDLPLCFKAGVGKYFSRQHFLGVSSDIALSSYGKYFNIGLRYTYQYDAYKRNVAFYLPIEVFYNKLENDEGYTVNDTLFDSGGFPSFPTYDTYDIALSNIGLSFGQGFSFIMDNKKSINVELTFMKLFNSSFEYLNKDKVEDPKSSYSSNGFRLSLLYNI